MRYTGISLEKGNTVSQTAQVVWPLVIIGFFVFMVFSPFWAPLLWHWFRFRLVMRRLQKRGGMNTYRIDHVKTRYGYTWHIDKVTVDANMQRTTHRVETGREEYDLADTYKAMTNALELHFPNSRREFVA